VKWLTVSLISISKETFTKNTTDKYAATAKDITGSFAVNQPRKWTSARMSGASCPDWQTFPTNPIE
jgi:hypothetical protein